MQNKLNWLLALWRREWEFWENTLVKQLRLELICIGAVFVIFVMSGAVTGRLSGYITTMPGAVLAFWGLPEKIGVPDGLTFMKWILMPLHVWIAWEACNRAMKTIWREEEGGHIYMLCNQWYTRYQIGIAKYTWIIMSFVIKYAIMFAVYICLALVACKSGQRMTEVKLFIRLFGKGICVIAFLISLAASHAMLHKRKARSLWADIVVLGTLALGNLYKVKDLLELVMKQSGRDFTRLIRVLSWSGIFKGLAPLSWLNPFTVYTKGIIIAQVLFCLILSGAAAVVGIVGYRIRKFE